MNWSPPGSAGGGAMALHWWFRPKFQQQPHERLRVLRDARQRLSVQFPYSAHQSTGRQGCRTQRKKARIVRSTMPYGPPYDAGNKDYEEGSYELPGTWACRPVCVCVNLAEQFEFIMKNWVMRGGFNGNLPATNSDPMIGLPDVCPDARCGILFPCRVRSDCSISWTPEDIGRLMTAGVTGVRPSLALRSA